MAIAAIRAVVFDFFGTLTVPVRRDAQERAVALVAKSLGVSTNRLMQVYLESFSDRWLGRWGSFAESVE